MKRLSIALTLLVAVTLVLAACTPAAPAATPTPTAAPDLLDEIMTRGSLRVSTDPNYAPQSFINDKGELDGFDVDVAKEAAKRLGVKVEFITPGHHRRRQLGRPLGHFHRLDDDHDRPAASALLHAALLLHPGAVCRA
ncbi:MAG: putative amino acid transporter, substrate-binding protein [Anaerolineales bacterium]|nr:putative amino acid transporter, substrate-binding protein [Anaerolineales bacterium]